MAPCTPAGRLRQVGGGWGGCAGPAAPCTPAGRLRPDGRGGGRGDKGGALRGAAALSGAEGPRTDPWPGSGADCERGRPQGAAWGMPAARNGQIARSATRRKAARRGGGGGGRRPTAGYREPAPQGSLIRKALACQTVAEDAIIRTPSLGLGRAGCGPCLCHPLGPWRGRGAAKRRRYYTAHGAADPVRGARRSFDAEHRKGGYRRVMGCKAVPGLACIARMRNGRSRAAVCVRPDCYLQAARPPVLPLPRRSAHARHALAGWPLARHLPNPAPRPPASARRII